MTRRDIIRRAFRDTGVGIDIDGIMRHHIKFPHFATYVPPEKDEEHNDELLTVADIDLLAAQEKKFQEELKKPTPNNSLNLELSNSSSKISAVLAFLYNWLSISFQISQPGVLAETIGKGSLLGSFQALSQRYHIADEWARSSSLSAARLL